MALLFVLKKQNISKVFLLALLTSNVHYIVVWVLEEEPKSAFIL